MKQKLMNTFVILLSLFIVGCSGDKTKTEECSNLIKLHKDGETIIVDKQDIVLIESHGSGTAISFNTELKKVNGLSRGKTIVFEESQEEVYGLINCTK